MLKQTEDILNDPSVHSFLKDIIRHALDKDLVDACYDIQIAAIVIKRELDAKFLKEISKEVNK